VKSSHEGSLDIHSCTRYMNVEKIIYLDRVVLCFKPTITDVQSTFNRVGRHAVQWPTVCVTPHIERNRSRRIRQRGQHGWSSPPALSSTRFRLLFGVCAKTAAAVDRRIVDMCPRDRLPASPSAAVRTASAVSVTYLVARMALPMT